MRQIGIGRPAETLPRPPLATVRVPEDEWSRRFADLLGRRGRLAAAESWTEDEVGRSVERAVAEVRRSRAAGRR